MVHLQYFDVPILAKLAGGLLDQCGQHGYAYGRVACLQNGNVARGIVDQEMVAFLQPGRTDDDRLSRRNAGVKIYFQRVRVREIDDYVGCGD